MAVLEVNNDSFNTEVTEAEGLVLVDFWAPWCGPCKMLGPLIDQLSDQYEGKIKFCKCNVDDNMDLAASHGVSNIPAVKIFKGGEVVSEMLGFKPLPAIKQFLDQALG